MSPLRDRLLSHPYTKRLIESEEWTLNESRSDTETSFTSSTLSGPSMIEAPLVFTNATTNELVMMCHLGAKVCGHRGIVHGGLLATLLDENLCRCAFPVLDSGLGVTAKLELKYLAPTLADSYVVLSAGVKDKQGRKVTVDGYIEALDFENEDIERTKLVEASILVIEPKWVDKLGF